MTKKKAREVPAIRTERYAKKDATSARSRVADPVRAGKKKVSVTIDEAVLQEVRTVAGSRPFSATVNDLLADALARRRLNQLVDELEAEAGPAPIEVYEQIQEEWDRAAKR